MGRTVFIWCVLLCQFCEARLLGGKELEWHREIGFKWAELDVSKEGKNGFTLLTPEQTGITFINSLDEKAGAANRVLYNGSGVAVGDYDNDGLPDIYFCSLNGRNALYKNLGNWKFKDVTSEAGVPCDGQCCRGAVFADVNGDGYVDLLVAVSGGGVICFLNDGHGKFAKMTQAAGTASKFGSMTMALADVDGNGTLDLYVVNNRTDDIRDQGHVDIQLVRGRLTIPPLLKDRLLFMNGQLMEYGEPDVLLLNDGRGRFTPASWTDGTFLDEAGNRLTNAPLDWGLSATFRDMNNDGLPDLYVCNDFWTPDRIWLNDGKGHFRAIAKLALRNTSASSMGVDFADIDLDGNLDFFVVDMLSRDLRLRKRQLPAQPPLLLPIGEIENRPQIMRNTLFLNRGDGSYAEIANFGGLEASEWSWQPVFIDVDLDGYEDLLITAGHAKDVQDADAEALIRSRQRPGQGSPFVKGTRQTLTREEFTEELMQHMRLYPRLDMPIVAFHNLGNLKFQDVTATWGTEQRGVHHAIALADFDGDGDMDFVVNNLGAVAGMYRNETSAPRVSVRLKGLPPNTQGIGSKIKLLNGAVPVQSQEVICGGRYMSGSDPLLVFAVGKAQREMTIEVMWRSGKTSVVQGVLSNRIYEIDERVSAIRTNSPRSPIPAQPVFKDVSELIAHVHHEEPYDDFERQPLLPRKLSQLGPGVAWIDVDGDGHEDLIVGSGKGGQLAVYRNDGRGGFARIVAPPYNALATRDQTTVLGWRRSNGQAVILAGSACYEDGLVVGSSVRQYDLAVKTINDSLPGQESSTGPLALADMDGDGNLDLFVGGRVVPGRYPEAASSRIYRSDGRRFQLDAENSRLLEKIGLVSGAVWSDLDGDGFPELILACEWGPIRIFKNRAGKLREATAELGLDKYTGWWNGVSTGDIDGDGKMDIIAGNWGLNSAYRATPEQPLKLYFGDLAGRGTVDLIETEYDPVSKAVAPRRSLTALSLALPFLRERFPTHRAFSEATISSVLGEQQARVRETEINTLASMIFFNRGNRFEAVALPREAQSAPVFSVNVGDFDGDGHEDIFLSENFFANQPETPRLDAGLGLWLQGDGTGKLRAVPGHESGVKVFGEQRGAALADFNEDGRVDLVVTQNGAATKLFQNVTAKPGLRVRLAGPPGNPTGAGAMMRLKFGPRLGPAREVHAGSGYWSQDSSIQVLGVPAPPTQLWIRWPGGSTTITDIPTGARAVTVDRKGALAPAVAADRSR